MPNQPQAFQVQRAARDISGRQQQIDSAVDAATASGGGGQPRNLMAGARRAMDMGGASRDAVAMQSDPAAGAQVEAEQSEMLRRMNAGEDPEAIRADIAERSQGPQLNDYTNPTPVGAMQQARASVDRMSADETEATPEEQAEYERAQGGLSKILYENVDTSGAVIDMLQPEAKVESVTQAAVMTITNLDKQMDLNENVFAELTRETVDRIVDLGEQTKGIVYTDDDVRKALGATWEAILNIYGDPDTAQQDLEELTQGMSDDDMSSQVQQYQDFLTGQNREMPPPQRGEKPKRITTPNPPGGSATPGAKKGTMEA